MKTEWQEYIKLIKRVVKPALGCTEPISAALASAIATRELGHTPEFIDVYVSDNLYKNSKGVFVPGTGKKGISISAAAGAIGGDPDAELEVLGKITPDIVEQAQKLINDDKIKIHRIKSEQYIYCSVIARHKNSKCIVTISGSHSNIVYLSLNDVIIYEAKEKESKSISSLSDNLDINIKKIYDFAINADFEDILFILEAAKLNNILSAEGLKNNYGLQIGRTIQENIGKGILSSDLMSKIQMYSSAASDARMGGASLPAMSNFGSGNQGIAATIPITVAAEHFKSSEEELARALIMSHLGAIYIKSHYPPLSAFCGNTVTSSAVAMGLVYLSKGSFEQSCFAMQNVMADTTGMICDGAKSSCSMKICSSSTAALRSMMLALRNCSVSEEGIVAKEVEQTIKNVGIMVSKGMSQTDSTIIEIMSI